MTEQQTTDQPEQLAPLFSIDVAGAGLDEGRVSRPINEDQAEVSQ